MITKILGLENSSVAQMCDSVNNALKDSKQGYAKRVTGNLIKSLEYISILNQRNPTPKIQRIISQLQNDYVQTFKTAKDLDLIDMNMLKDSRAEATHSAIVYAQTVSGNYSKVFAELAKRITQVILNVNPNEKNNGVPLDAYQESVLTF